MKPKYISFTEFMQWVIEYYPHMPTADMRPFKTIWRHLSGSGVLMLEQGEHIVLVKKHMRNNPLAGTPHTLIELLDRAQRQAESAAHKTKDNYKLQCIEEDLEEIEMLKEAWRTQKASRQEPMHNNLLFLRTAVPAHNRPGYSAAECLAPSEAEAFAEKMTKQWEEDLDGFFSDIAAAF